MKKSSRRCCGVGRWIEFKFNVCSDPICLVKVGPKIGTKLDN